MKIRFYLSHTALGVYVTESDEQETYLLCSGPYAGMAQAMEYIRSQLAEYDRLDETA